jgi:hypothetical protein
MGWVVRDHSFLDARQYLEPLVITRFFGGRCQMENFAPHNNKFEWQKPIYEALAEANPDKLTETIAEAERAIFPRFRSLEQSYEAAEGRLALHDASNILLALQREILRFPYGRTG